MTNVTTIVAAALFVDGLVISKPKPARHGDLIHPLYDKFHYVTGQHEQGFLTSDGEFVDRERAARIAVRAGQIESPKWGPTLFSEDLW